MSRHLAPPWIRNSRYSPENFREKPALRRDEKSSQDATNFAGLPIPRRGQYSTRPLARSGLSFHKTRRPKALDREKRSEFATALAEVRDPGYNRPVISGLQGALTPRLRTLL